MFGKLKKHDNPDTRIGITNVKDGLRLRGIGERGCNMDDGINACNIFSFLKYTGLARHKPFTACERSEVTRSSIIVVVNLLPKGS